MKQFAILFLFCAAWISVASGQSCVGRCGDEDQAQPCQCNSVCSDFGDCCDDYVEVCFSCEGRCGDPFVGSSPCHCNTDCADFGNCCEDYSTVCDGGGGDLEAEIIALAERLYNMDESVGELIVLDVSSSNPLFVSVDPSAFDSRTFQAFRALRDNYEADVCAVETSDDVENAELLEFLDAVFATAVMQETEIFLIDNGLVVGQTVREAVEESFLGWYSRCGSNLGSNGFEHSFMGELDGPDVSGYHNWVSFYEDELSGSLIYTSNQGFADISAKLSGLTMGFDWRESTKLISSMYIGSTPELELALYSIGFFYRANSLVPITLNGYSHEIQTWDIIISGTNYVGSAYPML